MSGGRSAQLFQRVDAIEHRLCRSLNRSCRRAAARDLFVLVSRLGDGPLWYLLIVVMPVRYGHAGLKPACVMAMTGLIGVAVYRFLKQRLVRDRPYVTFAGISAATAPLDRYSFPSGHTLHAVSFTLLATSYFPALAWLLVPFAALVATSRVVLGLHYPTDVLAGAVIGSALAGSALALT